MNAWFRSLREGLSRPQPQDRIAPGGRPAGGMANLRNLLPFLSRRWGKLLFGALLILYLTLLSLISPLVNRMLIDDVIIGRQLQLLIAVVVLLIFVNVSDRLVTAYESFYFRRFENDVLLDVQHSLLDRTLRFPKSFFDEKEVGYLISRLSADVMDLRWFFSHTTVYILSQVLRFVGGMIFIFTLEWRLAAVSLVALPFMVLGARYFAGKTRTLSHWGMEERANVSRQMQESLSAAELIKAFSSEERTVRKLTDRLRSALQISLEGTAVGSVAEMATNALPDLARLAVLIVGAIWAVQGRWTLGSLLAFQSYLGYVYGPTRFLASVNLQLQSALAALERVSALFDIVPEENLGQGMEIEQLQGDVAFENVTFSYADGPPVLEDLSCHIRAGEHVAIVGPSGVGKTTLISLLLRFYKPSAGEIWFDGRPASAYELGSLRRRIGYVSQSTLLLAGTIAENLRYGNPDASDEELQRACRAAGIHDFILDLPHGYATPLGEKGVNLSEGQRQRLAIARALIKDPDILVLDEPTAALDGAVERSILEALPAFLKGKTLFIVAHRLSTIRNSDRILLLNSRRVVATGTHKELLSSSDFYRRLFSGQLLQDSGPPASE
jgi:ABC-type bacteriocin/lantibiotic exporter with double-glycine peptidase domain